MDGVVIVADKFYTNTLNTVRVQE